MSFKSVKTFIFQLWVFVASVIAVVTLAFILLVFLSSRPAGASHGQPGQSISYCCRSVNPQSGTSYRMVALAFQPYRYTSVFEVGTQEIDYILQWPRLEPTTDILIRAARQRLAVVLAVDAAGPAVKEGVRLGTTWRHRRNAIGMFFIACGLFLLIIVFPRRKEHG